MVKEKKLRKAEKEYIEYMNSLPEWYWFYGLHDAEVLEINQLELPTDYKTEESKYNCLEISLDSKGARESNIKRLAFYNYKIVSGKIPDFARDRIFWLKDTLTQLPENMYKMELVLESSGDIHSCIEIEFQKAEVIRKK